MSERITPSIEQSAPREAASAQERIENIALPLKVGEVDLKYTYDNDSREFASSRFSHREGVTVVSNDERASKADNEKLAKSLSNLAGHNPNYPYQDVDFATVASLYGRQVANTGENVDVETVVPPMMVVPRREDPSSLVLAGSYAAAGEDAVLAIRRDRKGRVRILNEGGEGHSTLYHTEVKLKSGEVLALVEPKMIEDMKPAAIAALLAPSVLEKSLKEGKVIAGYQRAAQSAQRKAEIVFRRQHEKAVTPEAKPLQERTEEPKVIESEVPVVEAAEPVAPKTTDDRVARAQAAVDALNFNSTLEDRIYAHTKLRDAKIAEEKAPQVSEPTSHEELSLTPEQQATKDRLARAFAAKAALNFKATAEDHIYANAELRDAKYAWEAAYGERAPESATALVAYVPGEAPTASADELVNKQASAPHYSIESATAGTAEPEAAAESESHKAYLRLREQGEQPRDTSRDAIVVGDTFFAPEPAESEAHESATSVSRKQTFKDLALRTGTYLSSKLAQLRNWDYDKWREERTIRDWSMDQDFREQQEFEKGRDRALKIFLGVAGVAMAAMAVKAGIDMAGHLGSPTHDGSYTPAHPGIGPSQEYDQYNTPVPAPPNLPRSDVAGAEQFITGTGGSTEFTGGGLANAHEWLQDYHVKSGDTIWSLSTKYLQAHHIAHPDVYQVDAVKDSLLADFQQRGIVGADGWLRVGQTLKF